MFKRLRAWFWQVEPRESCYALRYFWREVRKR